MPLACCAVLAHSCSPPMPEWRASLAPVVIIVYNNNERQQMQMKADERAELKADRTAEIMTKMHFSVRKRKKFFCQH